MRLLLELLLLLGLCNAVHGNRSVYDLASADLGSGEAADPEDPEDSEDMTTTILRMNNGSSHFLLEGDMQVPNTRSVRKCLTSSNRCRWPRQGRYVQIPYVVSDKYDHREKSEIVRAMRDFESETCLRFVPRRRQRGYLSIEPKYGCSSVVGYLGGKQILSLQRLGCVKFGVIQHELMHALGFYHEHNRSDRDQYIRISWGNIKESYLQNFQRQDSNNLGTRYDYSSVMHYGRTAFGKSGMETITPIPNASTPIGQRNRASASDFLRINKLYCSSNRG